MQNNTKEIYNLIRLNKFDEAEKLVKSLIKNRGGNSEYNFIYGLILIQKKDILNAYKNFKISADEKNSSYDSNFNCGNCLQLLMRYDEAIKYYLRSNSIDPNRHEPYLQIGICFKRDKEYEKSITYLNKANSINKNVENYLVLGNVLREIGKFTEAKNQFESCLELENDNKLAQLSLINIEIDEGRLENAQKRLMVFLRDPCLIIKIFDIILT